jgi:hypothetical protein
LEAVGGGTSPLQSEAEVKATLVNGNKAMDNTKPMLVYLGYRQYYYVYDLSKGELVFSVQSKNTISISELVSSLATPEQYKQNQSEIDGKVLAFSNPLPVPQYTMYGASPYPNDCGPTSGAMISQYWKTWRPNLPSWATNHHELYVTMYCNNWFPGYVGTAPWNFGPGWLQYASNHGYSGYITDWTINRAFSVIQAEIDAGRPMGVMFSYNQSYTNWHWCVVKGYDGSGNILMNDPWGYSTSVNWAAVKLTSVITRIQNTT